jgi:acetyltransferase-like isoleucine patch superfamily enzyme
MGENCAVQNNVILSREHFLPGTISIGNSVLLAKNVFIDYSGNVVIKDGVKIANDVVIESHSHQLDRIDGFAVPGCITIDEGVKILTRAYIADTCHHIGRHARIGAGSYVRNNIPPYAIVLGNPGKIVGFVYTPEEMAEFERTHFPVDKRTSIDDYAKNYARYYKDCIKEISRFVKLKIC